MVIARMIYPSRLTKKLRKLKKDRAALTGIETAIILIAFVIVAAAFAFVVLNMGFYTSQRSKTVIQSGLGEASSAIELDGSVIAYGEPGDGLPSNKQNVTGLVIYIKLSSGRYPVELNEGKLVISYANDRVAFDNLYNSSLKDSKDHYVCRVIQVVGDNDTILEEGEKFKIFINLTALEDFLDTAQSQNKEVTGLNAPSGWSPSDVYLHPHDMFRIEIKPPVGAILTIERIIPPSIDKVMNLD